MPEQPERPPGPPPAGTLPRITMDPDVPSEHEFFVIDVVATSGAVLSTVTDNATDLRKALGEALSPAAARFQQITIRRISAEAWPAWTRLIGGPVEDG